VRHYLYALLGFIASGLMAAGYFMVHAPQAALPILNGGETAVLFCFLFLYWLGKDQVSGVWILLGTGPDLPRQPYNTVVT
jgi:putative oxidoreductase